MTEPTEGMQSSELLMLMVLLAAAELEQNAQPAQPQAMLGEFQKQQKRITKLESTVAEQQKQIEALTAGLQKVSAQIEASRPALQVVNNQQ